MASPPAHDPTLLTPLTRQRTRQQTHPAPNGPSEGRSCAFRSTVCWQFVGRLGTGCRTLQEVGKRSNPGYIITGGCVRRVVHEWVMQVPANRGAWDDLLEESNPYGVGYLNHRAPPVVWGHFAPSPTSREVPPGVPDLDFSA
jgi:hypothetical protein